MYLNEKKFSCYQLKIGSLFANVLTECLSVQLNVGKSEGRSMYIL